MGQAVERRDEECAHEPLVIDIGIIEQPEQPPLPLQRALGQDGVPRLDGPLMVHGDRQPPERNRPVRVQVRRDHVALGVRDRQVVRVRDGHPSEHLPGVRHGVAHLEQIPNHERNAEPLPQRRATSERERHGQPAVVHAIAESPHCVCHADHVSIAELLAQDDRVHQLGGIVVVADQPGPAPAHLEHGLGACDRGAGGRHIVNIRSAIGSCPPTSRTMAS